jgi:hypothetical protein
VAIGELQTRISEKYTLRFGIEEVIKPIYGYLFEPTNNVSGRYVRALYDGSVIKGYYFLVKEVMSNA